MATTRYRVIVKVLCENCNREKELKRQFDTQCRNCRFLKYNNVPNLKSFTTFLNNKFPNWVFFNVYEYIKGENGRKLASFVKGKEEPLSATL